AERLGKSKNGGVSMNALALSVQHKPQTQRAVVSSREPSDVQSPVSEVCTIQPPTPGPQYLTPPLVGRESELSHLQNVFETALQGERQVVFVTGEAGIGKTSLVDAFLARLRERADVRITTGQCVEHYGPGEAYMPLLEATTRLCREPGREQRIEGLQR